LDPRILDDVIKENQLDAICGLTMGPACSIDTYMEIVGRCFSHNSCSCKRLSAYYSALRKVYELPIGFSFFGTASEPELIGLAYAFEQASITELNLVSRNLL
jgi:amidase